MRKCLFIILLSFSFLPLFAKHIKGGFFTYTYLGKGINDPTKLRFNITLTIYMLCPPDLTSAQVSNPINFTIFRGNTSNQFANPSVNLSSQYTLGKKQDEPCILGRQDICFYTIVTYELDNYELPVSTDGYTISYQRCCRIDNMDNINNSGEVGNTYTIRIPGTSSPVPNAETNSSPQFPINDTIVVCKNSFFSYPFKATDADGDSLVYSLCNAYIGGTSTTPDPNPSSAPPYGIVPYSNSFLGEAPLGPGANINSRTGLISGIAPDIRSTGEYVVTVCVAEFRNGKFFAQSRKELHIRVNDCTIVSANLPIDNITCDGFTFNFNYDLGTSPSGTQYLWNFGDTASHQLNSSTVKNPTHTFTDSGIYLIKLKASLSGFCEDSATSILKVYPGFFPDFKALDPLCKGVPVQFQDATVSNYGTVTGWQWKFGNPTAPADGSSLQNPKYAYPLPGTYKVKLVVGNTKGCIDSVSKDIVIKDNPVLSLSPHDTTYCMADTLQLTASGTGNFSWAPNANIIDPGTATPKVYPTGTTKYIVTLNSAGCISRDSVTVRPANVTNAISADRTQVCEEDTITLTGSSNRSPVTWSWSPATSALTPTAQITKVVPVANPTYTLTSTWGKHCTTTASQPITTIPLAIPVIDPVTPFCAGQGFAQLKASGGNSYIWSPATGLSKTNIPDPVATPAATTTYTVSVGVAGCSKRREKSVEVVVRTLPPLTVTNDTLICIIDTLKLTATGNGNVAWSPNYNINNLTSHTPLVSPDVLTKYDVQLTDPFGCISNESVIVDVRTDIFVNAGKDTTICQTDTIILHASSEALQYNWTPALYLDNDHAKNPVAVPLTTQKYHVVANLGKCQKEDDVTITVVPYPAADAGRDTSLCFGASTRLHASGGSIYSWSPPTFLDAANIPNPFSIKPTTTTQYILTVRDVLGCPKAVKDTVMVNVVPIVVADAGPADTSIVIGEPLFLHGTGGDIYLWLPATWLDDASIASPVANPENNIVYSLLVKTVEGCSATDSIRVKVYRVPADLYVPTAFTPNNDGLNDLFYPVLLGIKQLSYFRIYNRWGELVFSTTQHGKGWNGTFHGSKQEAGNYVWMTEGITYEGKVIQKKGNVVLVR